MSFFIRTFSKSGFYNVFWLYWYILFIKLKFQRTPVQPGLSVISHAILTWWWLWQLTISFSLILVLFYWIWLSWYDMMNYADLRSSFIININIINNILVSALLCWGSRITRRLEGNGFFADDYETRCWSQMKTLYNEWDVRTSR